jgi:HEPN domain-containing protein
VTNETLAQSYLRKAVARLKILPVLMGERAYSDVVREAQEIVELALKGALRQLGIEPPKWHDVGDILLAHRDRLPDETREKAPRLAKVSSWLRKERELAFYGDIDFVPTEQYSLQDAQRAADDAAFVVQTVSEVIPPSTD